MTYDMATFTKQFNQMPQRERDEFVSEFFDLAISEMDGCLELACNMMKDWHQQDTDEIGDGEPCTCPICE